MHPAVSDQLGVSFVEHHKASIEFEWARKLMRGHPDPRTNLDITNIFRLLGTREGKCAARGTTAITR